MKASGALNAELPVRPRSRWSRAAKGIWLGWIAFAVLVVLAFAVIDRHNEGYKWLMAMLVLWGSAFAAAAPAAVCAAMALLSGGSPRRLGDGVLLLVSIVAAALSAPGGYFLAKGLSQLLPVLLR